MVTQVTTTAGNTRWGTPYGIQRRRVFKHRATILTRVSEGWLLGDIQKAIGLDDMPYKTFAGLVLKLKTRKNIIKKRNYCLNQILEMTLFQMSQKMNSSPRAAHSLVS